MASDLALPTLKLTKYFISLDLVFRQNRLIKFIAISAGIFCIRYFLEMHVIIISRNSKTISKIQDTVGMELGQNYSNVKKKKSSKCSTFYPIFILQTQIWSLAR